MRKSGSKILSAWPSLIGTCITEMERRASSTTIRLSFTFRCTIPLDPGTGSRRNGTRPRPVTRFVPLKALTPTSERGAFESAIQIAAKSLDLECLAGLMAHASDPLGQLFAMTKTGR